MNHEHFSTSDFPLVTTLFAQGFTLDYLDKSNPQRIKFCFKRDDHIDNAIQAYWSGQSRLNPQAIFAASKALKSRMYS